jgi:hypothetical protein
MTDFKNIEYLKFGNERQRVAYSVLYELEIFEYLKQYNPILTGTIPIDIDLPDSDLDIICECKDHILFAKDLTDKFGEYLNFKIWTKTLKYSPNFGQKIGQIKVGNCPLV